MYNAIKCPDQAAQGILEGIDCFKYLTALL